MEKRKRLDRRIGAFLRAALLWPLVGLLAVCGLRIARISNPGRIGHMAAEMDCFLKERALGLVPDIRPVLLLERGRAGNAALLDVFRQYVTVLDRRWHKLLLTPLTKFDALALPLGRPVVGFGEAARYPQVLWLWRDRPPAVALPAEMEAEGARLLAELGVPPGAWFVCLHVREPGYSPRDDRDHAHRNADIATYGPAIAEIRARGGWVVRVGDASMTPLGPAADPDGPGGPGGVVDYATSPLRRDWMDLWLPAHNRFFLGTSSGLAMLATMFHRPCALVNMVPPGAAYGMAEHDVSIPKRLLRDGRPIPLAEVFDSALSAQRYAWAFDEAGVAVENNSPAEIRALVAEMLDRLDGAFETTPGDEELQRRYRALLRPRDYGYGALGRIGRDWLRENRHLLEEA